MQNRKPSPVSFFSLIFFFGVSCMAVANPAGSAPSSARQTELLNLLRQDCGSCHGMRLTGGLGLPLTPEALKDKSPEALIQTVLYGRSGTPMPPWNPFLTEAEAGWIVDILLKGLPDAR